MTNVKTRLLTKRIYNKYIMKGGGSQKLQNAIIYIDSLSDSLSVMTILKIRNYYYDLNENDRNEFAAYIFKKFFKKNINDLDEIKKNINELNKNELKILKDYINNL